MKSGRVSPFHQRSHSSSALPETAMLTESREAGGGEKGVRGERGGKSGRRRREEKRKEERGERKKKSGNQRERNEKKRREQRRGGERRQRREERREVERKGREERSGRKWGGERVTATQENSRSKIHERHDEIGSLLRSRAWAWHSRCSSRMCIDNSSHRFLWCRRVTHEMTHAGHIGEGG